MITTLVRLTFIPTTMFLLMGFLCLISCAAMAASTGQNDFFAVRNGLRNSQVRFVNEKKGRVVFLGGSITTMTGWRDLTCEMLKKRFPGTVFDFINAGIGGTNSTLGAFRLETDVFKNGPVDLLFVEFAVNDAGGEGSGNHRVRAMEGIIRHARKLNPKIDLVIQYFADTDKVADIRNGKIPDAIERHDSVAAHYGIPIINMAKEMTRRMDAGEFTWQQFSGDTCHPSPFGHDRYAECISVFFDAVWATPVKPTAKLKSYKLPAPCDPLNYEHGRFIELDQAKIIEGWNRLPGWLAEKTCNYSGPVDVLAAEQPGATLELQFKGSLIGISAIAGMDAGTLEVVIDGGSPQTIDLYDHYCQSFHRPVCHILAEGLPPGKHLLKLRIANDANPKSLGHAARILKFTAN